MKHAIKLVVLFVCFSFIELFSIVKWFFTEDLTDEQLMHLQRDASGGNSKERVVD